MTNAPKATVTLGGVTLAGTSTITWRFQSGVGPYQTVMSVHRSAWDSLAGKMGQFVDLVIKDARGVETVVRDLTVMHRVPSGSPHRVSFIVADKRWKWPYTFVARDYNVPRRSGDKLSVYDIPFPATTVRDIYIFKEYSLDPVSGARWQAKDIVRDVLKEVEPNNFTIESFPIEGDDEAGQFSVQNVLIRDPGHSAIGRALSFVPGAEVYIDQDGRARVIDAADLQAANQAFEDLPPPTWDGEDAVDVDRSAIRPRAVHVYYEREFEALFHYEDDYFGNDTEYDVTEPYLENVIPTTDPATDVELSTPFKTLSGFLTTAQLDQTAPPGIWLRADLWIQNMEDIRLVANVTTDLEINFDLIRRHWVAGDIDAVLGNRGLDLSPATNISGRVQALKQHFRQTFRINQRVMDHVTSIRPERAAMLDPVTGSRAPAQVYGQVCAIPSQKGYRMVGADPSSDAVSAYVNVDAYTPSVNADLNSGSEVVSLPASVGFLDQEAGIFKVALNGSPYGTVQGWVPSFLVGEYDQFTPAVFRRFLSQQDTLAMGNGLRIQSGTNGLYMAWDMKMDVLMSVIAGNPRDKSNLHRVAVRPGDVKAQYRAEYGIEGGRGPILEVFVPQTEVVARFQWDNYEQCKVTQKRALGLDIIPAREMLGYQLVNEKELRGHARAMAAQALVSFADNIQGIVASRIPDNGRLSLKGNMAGITINVGAHPSAKVNVMHEFPGQQRPISRMALMPEATRHVVLGILQYRT